MTTSMCDGIKGGDNVHIDAVCGALAELVGVELHYELG